MDVAGGQLIRSVDPLPRFDQRDVMLLPLPLLGEATKSARGGDAAHACDLVVTELQNHDAHEPVVERGEHGRTAVDHAGMDRGRAAGGLRLAGDGLKPARTALAIRSGVGYRISLSASPSPAPSEMPVASSVSSATSRSVRPKEAASTNASTTRRAEAWSTSVPLPACAIRCRAGGRAVPVTRPSEGRVAQAPGGAHEDCRLDTRGHPAA